jgi:hypothetical protein
MVGKYDERKTWIAPYKSKRQCAYTIGTERQEDARTEQGDEHDSCTMPDSRYKRTEEKAPVPAPALSQIVVRLAQERLSRSTVYLY